jgi:hypothetical protein
MELIAGNGISSCDFCDIAPQGVGLFQAKECHGPDFHHILVLPCQRGVITILYR